MSDELWKRKRRRKVQFVEEAIPKPEEEGEEEDLTGYVNAKIASSHEERFARSLRKYNLLFTFRKLIYTPFQIPGQNYEIDFIVFEGKPQPIEIDDEWIHKSRDEQDQDALRDTLINDIIMKLGYQPIIRIKVDMTWTQEDFDELIKELF